jgi:DNA mismatch repair protein MutS
MQPDFTTPMMKQYFAIKKQYQDCLLFYRMGDFYELFMEDAHVGARVLNITLTGKSNGKNGRIPMAGVPYHAVDSYLSKLVKAGYKVAICEQLSPPNKKGLVERDVVRIVTPGTVMNENHLSKKANNYIISLFTKDNLLALAIADISTGYFATTQITTQTLEQTLRDELARIQPSECILSESLYNDLVLLKYLKSEKNLNVFPFQNWDSFAHNAKEMLKKHFGVSSLAGFGVENQPIALQTAAVLLGYLQETQKGSVGHIKKLQNLSRDEQLLLDKSTILNLELFSTIREHDTRGTLLSILDQTITAMGGRMLKFWIQKPLLDKKTITQRHEAVEIFLKKREKRETLRNTLQQIHDIERLLSRLAVGLGNARDLVNLKVTLQTILTVKKKLSGVESELINRLTKNIKSNGGLDLLITFIDKHIVAEPPLSIREGRMIQKGIDQELDRLRKIVTGSRDWILDLEQKERGKTGISSLKIRFNHVFGFYIEISKTNLSHVPDNYIRKQTLVNGERFITPELKKQEEIILTAEEKINEIEYQLFQEILQKVLDQTEVLQTACESIAILDCLLNFAHIAEKNNYLRPKLLSSGEMKITGGRHPVVEKLLEDTLFVPNDVQLDNSNQQLLLITGPNMAGKSVFIRQVALLVLMNQIGSFVPAEKAQLSIVDRIFVRSGASDVITSGLSTFMVEMVETAHILHHATKNSLIVMDEIGRGTSTYDGISIAWAVAEYLVRTNNAKTLFATHYHELQMLEDQYPKQIKNFHMSVAEDRGEPVFLHTILPGGASHSFGVAVAKLAGIPDPVIKRANELLKELEERHLEQPTKNISIQTQQINLADHVIHKELENLDIANMTPIEALNKLSELKDKLKLFTMQDKELLHAD